VKLKLKPSEGDGEGEVGVGLDEEQPAARDIFRTAAAARRTVPWCL
jgi:hypothetical protein